MSIDAAIGYSFKNGRLLKEALTHPSCAETVGKLPFNYQRLEFLGDGVLGVVIAELLFRLFPQEAEGSLAKRHAALVCSDSLAGIARKLGLGDYMRVASGEQEIGRANNSNLEDVCEAVIGAMYLDGGFEQARSFILTHFEPLAKGIAAPPKDAKTSLQEWAQGKGMPLPVYTVLETTGPAHAPEFTIEASVQSGEATTAKAASKRQAEQQAAKQLVEKLETKMSETYCGYAAIIGAPNAGKSTLLNALVGGDISIVTAKPQTTRGRIRGIVNEGKAQVILVDTPGIFDAKPMFEKAMVTAAWSGADEADVILLLVDANRGLDADTRSIVELLKKRAKSPHPNPLPLAGEGISGALPLAGEGNEASPLSRLRERDGVRAALPKVALVLNKVDKLEQKIKLPELSKQLYDLFDFDQSFMVSASRGDGIKDIAKYLAGQMPPAPWLYPDDELTDSSERDIAAEITREQCFLKLHAELPYSLMVETEKWDEKQEKGKRVVRINQIIVVERETHKKIILGKGGAMLKAIGSGARRKIGEALGIEAHLFLFVKVQENWKNDPASFSAAGLEYKK